MSMIEDILLYEPIGESFIKLVTLHFELMRHDYNFLINRYGKKLKIYYS